MTLKDGKGDMTFLKLGLSPCHLVLSLAMHSSFVIIVPLKFKRIEAAFSILMPLILNTKGLDQDIR